jgi:hypothetical protein
MSQQITETKTEAPRIHIGAQSISLSQFDTSHDKSIAVASGNRLVLLLQVSTRAKYESTRESSHRGLLGRRAVLHRFCGAGGARGRVAACWMDSGDRDTHMLRIDGLESSGVGRVVAMRSRCEEQVRFIDTTAVC